MAGASPYPLFPLESATGIAQHHDAITGTSKQHVAFDYARYGKGRLTVDFQPACNWQTATVESVASGGLRIRWDPSPTTHHTPRTHHAGVFLKATTKPPPKW